MSTKRKRVYSFSLCALFLFSPLRYFLLRSLRILREIYQNCSGRWETTRVKGVKYNCQKRQQDGNLFSTTYHLPGHCFISVVKRFIFTKRTKEANKNKRVYSFFLCALFLFSPLSYFLLRSLSILREIKKYSGR